ncbi:MAG: hypothetical protein FWF43_09335 [Propionibacteriaceae bacterium]|nr:hypothetical protein [Propionibacteriaceae bacterium]
MDEQIGDDWPYLVYVLVFVVILRRQLLPRPVKERPTLALVIMGVGLILAVSAIATDWIGVSETSIVVLAVSLVILAAGFGAIRAATCRVWTQDDTVMRRGTIWTLVLWVVTMGAHVYLDTLVRGSNSTALLYMGISLYVQQLIVRRRAEAGTTSVAAGSLEQTAVPA